MWPHLLCSHKPCECYASDEEHAGPLLSRCCRAAVLPAACTCCIALSLASSCDLPLTCPADAWMGYIGMIIVMTAAFMLVLGLTRARDWLVQRQAAAKIKAC